MEHLDVALMVAPKSSWWALLTRQEARQENLNVSSELLLST